LPVVEKKPRVSSAWGSLPNLRPSDNSLQVSNGPCALGFW